MPLSVRWSIGGIILLEASSSCIWTMKLKFIQGQHKLNPCHAKYVGYLQSFHFMIHHKSAQINKGADALSWRYLILSVLETKVLGFEVIKGILQR